MTGDDAGPVAWHLRQAALTLGLRTYQYRRWERSMIRRRPDGDYRAIHGRKFLHNVARLRRRWCEDLGAEVTLVEHRDDRDAVKALIALEGAGYKRETGVALNLFPDEVAWFEELCDRMRAKGRLRLWSLESKGAPLAFELGLIGGDGLFLLKVTFDEAHAKYTPGIQLHLDVINQFDAMDGVEWIDSCTYEGNETMLRMYPDRRSVATLVVATGGLVDRGILSLVAVGRRYAGADSALRRHLPARWRSR